MCCLQTGQIFAEMPSSNVSEPNFWSLAASLLFRISDFTSIKTDGWNLHTFPNRGVSPDKISYIVSNKYGNSFDMLSMIIEVRKKCMNNQKRKEQVNELVFLNNFLEKTNSLENKTTMSM